MGEGFDDRIDGHEVEQLVATLLRSEGFVILEVNYRVGHLEVDIIALEGNTLCFIEVKARRQQIPVYEIEATIPRKKQELLTMAADAFCRGARKLSYTDVRFDYALVHLPPWGEMEVKYIRNAFTPTIERRR